MTRSARVPSLAKINLDLRVLHKRPDGFHELRSVFQTVSLADSLGIDFAPGRRRSVTLEGNVDIPDNLVVRAANALLDVMKTGGTVHFRLGKKIPMGAGMGGGSSNAAAVLLALPVLAGKVIPLDRLMEIGTALGSDVPFFLLGGTALGLGRGTELYPLAEQKARPALLVAPGVHISTAEAYKALNRGLEPLTTPSSISNTSSFQQLVWELADVCSPAGLPQFHNDFESVAFTQFPRLKSVKRFLLNAGAERALMTGSGSALFGIFSTQAEVEQASRQFPRQSFPNAQLHRITLVSRSRYRSLWRRALHDHLAADNTARERDEKWPPRSRYAQ